MERERDISKSWDQRSRYSPPYGGQHSYRKEQDDNYRNSYKWEKKDPPTSQNKKEKQPNYFSENGSDSSRDSGTIINLYSRKEISNDGRDYLSRSANNATPGGQDFSVINNTINLDNNSSSFHPKEQHNSNRTRWKSPSGSVSPQNFEFAQRSTKLQDDYRPAKIAVERKDDWCNRSYDNRPPTFVDRTHHSSFEKRNNHSKKFYDDESKIHLEKKSRNFNVAETCFEESDCHFKRANVGVAETHMTKRDSYSKINYDDEPQIRLERRYSDHSSSSKYDDILHLENRGGPNNRHRNRSSDRFEKRDSHSSRNYDDESKICYRKRHYEDVFRSSDSSRNNNLSETEKRDHYSKNCSDDEVDHTRLAKRVGNSNRDYNDQLKKGWGNDNRFNRDVHDRIQSRSEKKDGHYNRNYGDTPASLEKTGGHSKVYDGASKTVFEKNRYKRNYSLEREGRNLESRRDWPDRNYDCKNKGHREEGNVIPAFGNLTSLCTKEERSYSNSQNFNSNSTAVSHTAAWCMDDDSDDDPWEDADIVSTTDCVTTPLPDKDTPGKRKRKRVHRNWRKRDIEWQRKKALQNTANVRVETQTIGQVRATENINKNLKFTTPRLISRIVPINGKKNPRKRKKNKFHQMNTCSHVINNVVGTQNRNNHSSGIAASHPIKGARNQKQEIATDLLDADNGSRTMGTKYVGQIMKTKNCKIEEPDNVVETRNDNIVQIKGIDRVDNVENIDTIVAAGNANQFPQIENIYNALRYLASPMFGNIIVIPNIIPTANTVPIFNVLSNSVPTENYMIPKIMKRDRSLTLYNSNFMDVTPETAPKLLHPDGVNFLRILGERTNLKLDMTAPRTSDSLQYTVTLEGPNEQKPKARAAIKRYCGLPTPQSIYHTLSELKPSSDFSLEALRSILKRLNNRSMNWRKVTRDLFEEILVTEVEIRKREQMISANQFTTPTEHTGCERVTKSLVGQLQIQYKALNMIVLTKLEVGNVVHMQALKQWAESGDPPEAPVSLKESYCYVFHNANSLGIDYDQIINRLSGDEKFPVVQEVNNLFQCGLQKCTSQESESAMRQLKDRFCEVVIDDYDGESLDAFRTFCAQIG